MNTLEKHRELSSNWGRASRVSLFTLVSCFFILTMTPLMVFYFYIALAYFDASLIAPAEFMMQKGLSQYLPSITGGSFALFFAWLLFQGFLSVLPDKMHKWIPFYQGGYLLGAVTPAGNRLPYNINGLQAWVISHFLFITLSFGFNLFSPSIIFDQMGPLLWVTNSVGFALALFVYIKALYFPSFPNDRKFSGNRFYDFIMGVELNPRIGLIDLKLFFNGRPGIVAWTLINLSFASAQYAKFGFVTNSMIIVNFLQALYVLYFFWKEAWYLKTIDIHHDHFGWMLAWGDTVWLPYMYTLQALYLVYNPVQLSSPFALVVLFFGLVGFYIFAAANNQKDRFRALDGKMKISGKQAEYIECEYLTQDGQRRQSKLLVSGWWAKGRHMNYTGDLLLSLCYSLACGTDALFPYFYFIFLSILLIHRCIRDEMRCLDKYGSKWQEYCRRVPYRLIPYIW